MSLRELAVELGSVLREYWPSLLATALVGGAALALFGTLRHHEDRMIQRMLEAEGRYLASTTAQALDARTMQVVEIARRWEGFDHPDSVAWQNDVLTLSDQDPVWRAFEWRDPTFRTVWAVPWLSRRTGGDLDTTFDSARGAAAEVAVTRPEGSVSGSFPAARGERYVEFAAPMLKNGARLGTITALVRARDLLDAILLPELRRGYTLAVREGPYRLYGAIVVNEDNMSAIDWWSTVPVRAGDLQLAIDFWPTPELMAKLRSHAPGLVLLFGCVLAVALGSLVRTAQLAGRPRRS